MVSKYITCSCLYCYLIRLFGPHRLLHAYVRRQLQMCIRYRLCCWHSFCSAAARRCTVHCSHQDVGPLHPRKQPACVRGWTGCAGRLGLQQVCIPATGGRGEGVPELVCGWPATKCVGPQCRVWLPAETLVFICGSACAVRKRHPLWEAHCAFSRPSTRR